MIRLHGGAISLSAKSCAKYRLIYHLFSDDVELDAKSSSKKNERELFDTLGNTLICFLTLS